MPRRKKLPMPEFASEQQEAEFWDTHSPLDYEGWEIGTEPVQVKRPLEHVLQVRLDARTIDELMRIGQRIGIGPSTLARIWIMERLAALEAQAKSAS
ncbi:MAG: hypothetical protein EPO21_08600 [Chloroflexota bacterium]|nr:MAG: hypothetical protein EPO21_08600 [Chloroflexota bacterium]